MRAKQVLRKILAAVAALIVFYAALFVLSELFYRAVDIEMKARDQQLMEALKMTARVDYAD